MTCLHCGGDLVHASTTYAGNRKGFHLILDDVPAWICDQCGEPLFDEATVDAIQRMLRVVEDGVVGLGHQAAA